MPLFGKSPVPSAKPAKQPDPAPQPQPTPSIQVPVEQWDRMTKAFELMSERLAAPPPTPVAAPQPPPPIPDVPDEQYYGAVREAQQTGEWTKVQQMDQVRRAATEERAYRRAMGEVAPQLELGMQALSHLSAESARKDKPYYELFQQEIEQQLAALPSAQRTDKRVHEAVYQMVVGKPDNMNRILDMEREKLLRQQVDSPAPDGGGGRPRMPASKELPTPEAIFGSDGLRALQGVNRDLSGYLSRMGYRGKDQDEQWQAFLKDNASYYGITELFEE